MSLHDHQGMGSKGKLGRIEEIKRTTNAKQADSKRASKDCKQEAPRSLQFEEEEPFLLHKRVFIGLSACYS